MKVCDVRSVLECMMYNMRKLEKYSTESYANPLALYACEPSRSVHANPLALCMRTLGTYNNNTGEKMCKARSALRS